MLDVSVILPTYNRLRRLEQVLGALEEQSYPLAAFEVIVVSDGSTDGTNQYLQNLRTPLQLNVVLKPNGGPAAARNKGIKCARGEIILFLDDDVVPAPHLIAEHIRLHAEHTNAVALGPMLSPDGFRLLPWVNWEQAMLMKQYTAMQEGLYAPTARQFYTGNTSLPRHLLLQAGGFDERFRRAEDIELAYRLAALGATFIFHPSAAGYHYAERSFRSWLETPYAYGRNDVIFAQEKQQSWIFPTMRKEFRARNMLIRLLVQACLDRTVLSQGMINWFKHTAAVGHCLGLPRLSQAAYSAIFNLRYYQGVADELGGKRRFLNKVSHAA